MTQDPNYPYQRPDRPDAVKPGNWGIGIVVALIVILGCYLLVRAWHSEPTVATNTTDTTVNPAPDRRLDSAIPAAGVQGPATLPASGAALDTLLGQPDGHYGQSVNVQGVVKTVLNNSAFTVAPAASSDQEILVVFDHAPSITPAKGERIRVVGTFDKYDQSRVQETLGSAYNQEQFSIYAARPTITATRIERVGDMAQ